MPQANQRVLNNLFVHHLHFTPTPDDTRQFEADLAVISPSLMKASLIELSAGTWRPAGGKGWRKAMFDIYNRKVAEHAKLFPVFHCFETAFRSHAAVVIEEQYKIPQWWGPLYKELNGGPQASIIGVQQSVNAERRKAIRIMVGNMMSYVNVMACQDGYELLENAELADIKRIILAHWPIFKAPFRIKGNPISENVFRDKFDKVRLARNDVYHHKSFGGMTDVYDNANDLLRCINFSLPVAHKRIAAATCADPSYF